jgi:hypothetical protein
VTARFRTRGDDARCAPVGWAVGRLPRHGAAGPRLEGVRLVRERALSLGYEQCDARLSRRPPSRPARLTSADGNMPSDLGTKAGAPSATRTRDLLLRRSFRATPLPAASQVRQQPGSPSATANDPSFPPVLALLRTRVRRLTGGLLAIRKWHGQDETRGR